WSAPPLAQIERLQIRPQLEPDTLVLQAQMDRRSDEPERLPGIESGAFELVGVHRLTFEQAIEGVHEPDFAGASGRGALKNIEDLRCNDEAADGSQVRGG